jgi:hypothetical protein
VILSASLGLALKFTEMASLELRATGRTRDSNIVRGSQDRLDYDDLVFALSFRYGFSPERNYL